VSRRPRRGHDPLTLARLRLEVRRSLRPLLLWISLGAAALYAMFFLLAHLHIALPWQHQYSFQVAVPNAHGVVAGDEVRIAGVPVGTVTGVSLRGNQPVLRVEMGPQYAPVYRNARAELRPNTPLDDMYLDIISRGTPGAGRLGPQATLAADRTASSVDIGEVLDVFSADVRPRMATAITQLARGLGNDGPQFRQALVELAPFLRAVKRLSAEVATRRMETEVLVHDFTLMMAELAYRDRALRSLIQDAGTTFTTLGDNSGSLQAFITALPPALQRLPVSFSALRQASVALNPALSAMLPAAHALPSGLSALDRFAIAERPAANSLRRALPGLTALLAATTPVGENLGSAFAELQPQAPWLDHATRQIIPCEKPVDMYFQWYNSIYKFGDDLSSFLRMSNNTGAANAVGEPDPFLVASPSCTGTAP
jgi:ABC-type transporter Mla subunit MlaD